MIFLLIINILVGVFIREKLPKNCEGQKNKCVEFARNSTHSAAQLNKISIIFQENQERNFKNIWKISIPFLISISNKYSLIF